MSKKLENNIKKRVFWIFVPFIIVAITLAIKIFYIAILVPDKNFYVNKTQLKDRGLIKDRNGQNLAMQILENSVTIWAPDFKNYSETELKQTANILSETLNIFPGEIYSGFKGTKDYYVIKKNIPEQELNLLNEQIKKGILKNIKIESKLVRYYPKQTLASHILGFLNFEGEAVMGIEKSYNDLLESKEEINSEISNVVTNDIYLTIDINTQFIIEKYANNIVENHNPDKVIIIVMDAKSGEILGLTNRPTFNPNLYNRYEQKNLFNSALGTAYEPGSVFKIFTLAIALDSNSIAFNQHLHCPGYYIINDSKNNPSKIKCWNNVAHGDITAENIIINSCNVGACLATEKMKNSQFYTRLLDFGFANKTDLNIGHLESKGVLSRHTSWSLRTKPTISMGQEILTTPIQLITAATALSNEGKLLKPKIIKKIVTSNNEVIQNFSPQVLSEVISRKTAKDILGMMKKTTLEGTGIRAGISGINISTKTGTAEIYDNKLKKYSPDKFVASVIAILPTENPQLIIYGAAINPKGDSIFGSKVIAPIIKNISEDLIIYYQIKKDSDTIIQHSGNIYAITNKNIIVGDKIPNLIGKSKRDLIQLFNKNIKIKIIGDGVVTSQSPNYGEKITKDTIVTLYLE